MNRRTGISMVAVFAALLALAIMSAWLKGAPAIFESIIAPAGPGNQRDSEGAILPLSDGRLLLAWSDYYTADSSDWGAARISAMISKDGGRSWGEKFTFQENIAKLSVAQPAFLRVPSGKVLFFLFLRTRMQMYVRCSESLTMTPRPSPLPSESQWIPRPPMLASTMIGRSA